MSCRRIEPAIRRHLLGPLLLLALSGPVHSAAAQVQSLSAAQAGNLIKYERGARVVLIYSTSCKYSHEMFPEVVRLAERYSPEGVGFLAFSIDPTPGDINAYLASVGYPFARLHIRPWQPGELTAALAQSGITLPGKVQTPQIAVLDADGNLVGQHVGGLGARRAERWLRSLGLQPRGE